LAETSQRTLPLSSKPCPVLPRILLIDHDADRLLARRKLFVDRKIDTEITTGAVDGLARLKMGTFRLVILDYLGTTIEDHLALMAIQQFNLLIPVINVAAWASVLRRDNRLLNRDLLRVASRLCRLVVPDRLRDNQVERAGLMAPQSQLFDTA